MSTSHPSRPESVSDATVRLLTNVSNQVIPAANATLFGETLSQALSQDLVLAAAVYVAGDLAPLATAGDAVAIAETEMHSVGESIAAQPVAQQPGAVTSRLVSETDSRTWVVAPLTDAKATRGFVLTLIDAQDPMSKIGTMQSIKLAVDMAGRHFDQGSPSVTAVPELHRSLDLKQTSHTVANELRRQLRCDRISVFLKRGSKFRLQSVSGQARINRRANVVQRLRKLVQQTATMRLPFCYPTNTEQPPQIETALQRYLDESDVQSVCIVPIHRPTKSADDETKLAHRPIFGALAFESFQAGGATHESILESPLINEATTSLHNAKTHSQILLLPLWKSLGRGIGENPMTKLFFAVLALGLLVAALCLIETDYYVHADGTLQTTTEQRLFASSDGIVGDIHVEHGQRVEKGDQLLEIKNAELDQRSEQVLGELQIARQQLAAISTQRLRAPSMERERDPNAKPMASLAAETRQVEAQIANLTQQQELLQKQQERLQVVAPIAGEIVTWDVHTQLRARPVNRGEMLVTVADVDGSWQLHLDLPEQRIQRLLDAKTSSDKNLPVHFVLGTDPSHYYKAELTSVADSAQVDEQLGLSVKLKADLADDLELVERRVGADVRAKIPCGKHSLGYVWFHDVVDFVRMRFLFYVK